MNLREVKNICRKNSFVPLRRRGQNFLIKSKIIKQIVSVAELDKKDIVLEIGSGLGVLTEEIANECKKVVAIEIDKDLVRISKELLEDYKNVEIIRGSILDGISNLGIGSKKYKVVASIPFNIASRILRILLTQKNKPKLIIVVVQKEVAQRIIAKPPNMSLLSLTIQFYGQVNIVFNINRNNFWPQPRVDSTALMIKPNKSKINKEIENIFFQIISAGFSSKRKYLLNNLSKSVIIQDIKSQKLIRERPRDKHKKFKKGFTKNPIEIKIQQQFFLEIFRTIGMNEKVRAQELSLEQWIEIAGSIKNTSRFGGGINN